MSDDPRLNRRADSNFEGLDTLNVTTGRDSKDVSSVGKSCG